MEFKPRALKKHKLGFETEFLILEEDGQVSVRADNLIERCIQAKLKFPVHKDYTHNMIEISSIAHEKVTKGAHVWLQTMKRIIKIGKEMGVRIYPFGTYHGTHVPAPRADSYYRMCEDVLGPSRYVFSTGHSMGFHLHYCLPYGTFNRRSGSLRHLFRSKYKEQLLSVYNAFVAIDPAVTNFMESSPFIDGRFIGKDSRLLLYRAMKVRRNDGVLKGLFHDLPIFGRLPHYTPAISDLIMLIQQRQNTWKEIVEERFPVYTNIAEARHPLMFNWGPLRINKVGTFEYRGADMNLPINMIATSLMIKYFVRKIRKDNLSVKPSDIGIKTPFKIEGEVIYVPPYSYLSDVLQYKSALFGLADDEVYKYTKNMSVVAMKEIPVEKDICMERINRMLKERKTVSDDILEKVERAGYDVTEKLDEGFARELALSACDDLEKEVDLLLGFDLAIDIDNWGIQE